MQISPVPCFVDVVSFFDPPAWLHLLTCWVGFVSTARLIRPPWFGRSYLCSSNLALASPPPCFSSANVVCPAPRRFPPPCCCSLFAVLLLSVYLSCSLNLPRILLWRTVPVSEHEFFVHIEFVVVLTPPRCPWVCPKTLFLCCETPLRCC